MISPSDGTSERIAEGVDSPGLSMESWRKEETASLAKSLVFLFFYKCERYDEPLED